MSNEPTHIWFTPGPASIERFSELFAAGATGVRLTFSYGTPEIQLDRAKLATAEAKKVGKTSYNVADLAGEKFRISMFEGTDTMPVTDGTPIHLVMGESSKPIPENMVVAMSNPNFFTQLEVGNHVMVGDGSALIKINEVGNGTAEGVVVGNGSITCRRGMTIQGANFRPICLTEKDKTDLEHIVANKEYDAVVLSFVSTASDVEEARAIMEKGGRKIPLISKIETVLAVENAEEIAKASDMVMIARGDLALAMPWVELYEAVVKVAEACNKAGTPWVLATQVAEGLERFTIPTRAEICDLAHWVEEGAAAILLSSETAFGQRPMEAVKCVREVVDRYKK